MKNRVGWIFALLLALGLVLAAAQWRNEQPEPLVGGITKTEDADGITVEIDLSGDMLIWENARGGGSTDTEWRNVTIKGVFKDPASGEKSFETEEFSVEGLPILIPKEAPGAEEHVVLNHLVQYDRFVLLIYSSVYYGKVDQQLVGEIFFSEDYSKFMIYFMGDEIPELDGKIASYPAQTREEAVALAGELLKGTRHPWSRVIWE